MLLTTQTLQSRGRFIWMTCIMKAWSSAVHGWGDEGICQMKGIAAASRFRDFPSSSGSERVRESLLLCRSYIFTLQRSPKPTDTKSLDRGVFYEEKKAVTSPVTRKTTNSKTIESSSDKWMSHWHTQFFLFLSLTSMRASQNFVYSRQYDRDHFLC